MPKGTLKYSLLGYSPKRVVEYINYLSEDYSRRLNEKDKAYKKEIEKLYKKINYLEEENQKLKNKS